MHLSVTGLNNYYDCQYLYKLRYVDKIYKPASIYMTYGTVMHEVFEQMTTGKLPQKDAAFYFQNRFLEELANSNTLPARRNALGDKLKQAATTINSFDLSLLPKVATAEYGFKVKVDDLEVTGKIDAIGENGELWDYKTGSGAGPLAAYLLDTQMTMYSFIYENYIAGKPPTRLFWVYLDMGKVIEIPLKVDVDYAQLVTKMMFARDNILGGLFIRRADIYRCKDCEYLGECSDGMPY